ncbi:MAG: hypothetical protein KF749_00525 [Bacteroidetes bacterium]|nr:hypothetical protein [Bacteroidota bacterium]MCW5895113.1 hypothetical protein [Bacteroidota bacterium]
MSRTIKMHTPAGRVRLLNRKGRRRAILPFAPFPDESVLAPQSETGPETEQVPVQVAQTDPFDIEQRLNNEYKAGFEEGRRFTEKSLHDELAARLSQNRAVVEQLAGNIVREYERLQREAERCVVALALGIAERIVKREVMLDNEMVVRQIHEATKRIIGVERIKIRVNPADEEFVRNHRTQILASSDAVRDVAVEGDETIERGGCILESESGNVDALIATQMERIGVALLGEQPRE